MNSKLRQINRILIANRGEIAVRIIKTAHKMGIECIAIYTQFEEQALHVKNADISVLMPGNKLQDTYLNQELIISIAQQYFADAIHPGYGFLSENSDFAALCKKNKINFIGPSAHNIEQMGNKEEANKIAFQHNVPLLKKLTGSIDSIVKNVNQLKFPLIIKAAAGGGGKGMRLVHHINELQDMINKASEEAFRYFGNKSVYVEQYIENPRHIEVQILGDQFGNLIHLYERDCSIQRRHQKIIEEAPAPNLPDDIRNKILSDALIIAKSIGYTNAGTIEFILSPDNQHFFLEMNARIQVEHTVTEEITGVDIVEQQILIAMGHRLNIIQDDIKVEGHAIEVRLYSEDPQNNYLPSHGVIRGLDIPNIPNIRIDNGISNYEEIHSHFDSLLKKVTSKGNSRTIAIEKLTHFLKAYALFGIETNRDILLYTLNHKDFIKGNFSTSFISNVLDDAMMKNCFSSDELKIFASAYIILKYKSHNSDKIGYWRQNRKHNVTIGENNIDICVLQNDPEVLTIQLNNDSLFKIKIVNFEKHHLSFTLGDTIHKINYLHSDDHIFHLQYNGKKISISDKPKRNNRLIESKTNNQKILQAPTPGNIVEILVKKGQSIKKGDALMVLEAMKTENTLIAWKNTIISHIPVKLGEHVSLNQRLLETE